MVWWPQERSACWVFVGHGKARAGLSMCPHLKDEGGFFPFFFIGAVPFKPTFRLCSWEASRGNVRIICLFRRERWSVVTRYTLLAGPAVTYATRHTAELGGGGEYHTSTHNRSAVPGLQPWFHLQTKHLLSTAVVDKYVKVGQFPARRSPRARALLMWPLFA